MTPEGRNKLHEAIKEALKNCPPGHHVMLQTSPQQILVANTSVRSPQATLLCQADAPGAV